MEPTNRQPAYQWTCAKGIKSRPGFVNGIREGTDFSRADQIATLRALAPEVLVFANSLC
jgi:hypothetical protein